MNNPAQKTVQIRTEFKQIPTGITISWTKGVPAIVMARLAFLFCKVRDDFDLIKHDPQIIVSELIKRQHAYRD